MALIVTTFLWGGAYGEHYVKKLAAAVHRNLVQPHRFIAFTDSPRHLPGIEQYQIPDTRLVAVRGCFVRLQLFGSQLQKLANIRQGDKVLNLDLDVVITGELDSILERDDSFTILQGINTTNPCCMNGSMWMFRAGERPDVWTDFSLENYKKYNIPFHSFPDDQGFFEYKFPQAGSWGPDDGVFGFKKRGWPSGDALPDNARVVAFPGWRDPSKFEHLNWVNSNWRE